MPDPLTRLRQSLTDSWWPELLSLDWNWPMPRPVETARYTRARKRGRGLGWKAYLSQVDRAERAEVERDRLLIYVRKVEGQLTAERGTQQR